MKKISLSIAHSILLICLALGSSQAAETINVGVLLPLTGKLAKYGDIEQKSFMMAAEEINAAEDFEGKKIELIIEDTQGKSDVGRSAIEKLIREDGVVAIGGGFSSSVTWETSKIAQQNKVPYLVNTAAADKITEQGWEYIFRLNPPVSEYPATLNLFVKTESKDALDMLNLVTVTEFKKYKKKVFTQVHCPLIF